MGDYKVSSNTLMSSGPVPNFGTNEIRVTNREFLGNVTGSETFTSTIYSINPGLSATFPWLSQIAANYEQYKINGMIFQFVTTSGTAVSSTNTALGQVMFATTYDPIDSPFTNTTQMLTTLFSNYGVPHTDLVHAIECDVKQRPTQVLYVRNEAVPAGSDPRFYDLGITTIATTGMQAAAQIGGLWVSYDVTFMKPVIRDASATTPGAAAYSVLSGGNPFTSPVTYGDPSLPLTVLSATTSLLSFQCQQLVLGDYVLCTADCTPGAITWTADPEYIATTNCNVVYRQFCNASGGVATSICIYKVVSRTPTADFAITAAYTGTPTGTTLRMFFTPVSPTAVAQLVSYPVPGPLVPQDRKYPDEEEDEDVYHDDVPKVFPKIPVTSGAAAPSTPSVAASAAPGPVLRERASIIKKKVV